MLLTTWWGSDFRNSRDRYTLSYTEPTLGKAEDNLLMEERDPVLLLAERPTRSSAGELLLDWMLDGVLLNPTDGDGLFIREAVEDGDSVWACIDSDVLLLLMVSASMNERQALIKLGWNAMTMCCKATTNSVRTWNIMKIHSLCNSDGMMLNINESKTGAALAKNQEEGTNYCKNHEIAWIIPYQRAKFQAEGAGIYPRPCLPIWCKCCDARPKFLHFSISSKTNILMCFQNKSF